ncbi:MAG: di-heme oxidoredictase family protein [Bdellovibrionota bacterium]
MITSIFLFLITLSAGAQVPAEEFPAGTGTITDLSVNAFSHPLSGTRAELRREFVVGNSFFNTVWVTSPASTTARDGLGPIFNAVACSACHFRDGRGRGLPDNGGRTDMSLLFRLRQKTSTGSLIPHPAYGGQFQPVAIEGVQREGTTSVTYEKIEISYNDGILAEITKPIYEFLNLSYGLLSDTIASPRVAPQMVGLGLLENVSEKDILAQADPFDMDGDGISGRPNMVHSEKTGTVRMGRFGWKAGKASLLEQNAAAFNGDMGITSYLFPQEECTSVQTDCIREMTTEDIDRERLHTVTTYTQLLAVPVRRDFQKPEVIRGNVVFKTIGCASCHTPSFTTMNEGLEPLRNQTIYPYTDMLLHDMGPDLADDTEILANEDEATTHEWRTPPLWALGLTKTVNNHTRYLHDGRARNLTEAILWHGGEGLRARDNFRALSESERSDLIEFLNSL